MYGYDKASMLSKDPLNAFDIIIRKSLHLHTVKYFCKRNRNMRKDWMTSIQDISNLLEFLLRKIKLIWLTLSTIPLTINEKEKRRKSNK